LGELPARSGKIVSKLWQAWQEDFRRVLILFNLNKQSTGKACNQSRSKQSFRASWRFEANPSHYEFSA